MTDDLEHLTDEERKTVLEMYPKEIVDLESTDDGSDKSSRRVPAEETTQIPEVDKPKAEWKDGYLEYDVKTKDSDRVVFDENEIEITEEELE